MKVILHLTERCNLRCKYCYAPSNIARQSMTLETGQQAIDLALAHDRPSACVSYFGGEPLLMFDTIRALTRYALHQAAKVGKAMHFRLSTNGLLFDADILRFCRVHNILFALSMDGDRAAHDAQRVYPDGRGSFADLDAKLPLILEYNPHTVVTSVVTPTSIPHLASSLEYMWERGIRYMAHAVDFTHPDWTPDRMNELEAAYRQMAEFYLTRVRAGEWFHLSLFDDKIKSHARSPFKLGQVCDFGDQKVSVAPDGRILPCVRFVSDQPDAAGYQIGHVTTGFTARREALVQLNRSGRPQCQACDHNGRCTNFCGCLNWQTTGDITQVAGIVCAHERMLIPIADEVGNILWDEQSAGFLAKHYRQHQQLFPYRFD